MASSINYRYVLHKLVDTTDELNEILRFGDKYRVFEAVVILLGISGFLFKEGIPQTGKFSAGTIQNMKNINEIIDKSICQGGDESDFTIINDEKKEIYPVSVKAGENVTQTSSGVQPLIECKLYSNYKIIPYLVLLHKDRIVNKRKSNGSLQREDIHKELEKDGRIYGKDDIDKTIKQFREKFSGKSVDYIINYINTDILRNKKRWAKLRIQQAVTKMSIIRNLNKGITRLVIGHKPRSGKSITSLSIISELINLKKIKKCLLITSIPETLKDYMGEINRYHDFDNLSNSFIVNSKTVSQDIDENFEGIIFSSVQFLKMDKTGVKDNWLLNINADIIIIDESHYGSSTDKTNKKILRNISKKNKKPMICVSGTPTKTNQFYNIQQTYEWTFIDESFMRNIDNADIYSKMIERHGIEFDECMKLGIYDTDYSKCPIPILIRPELPQTFIKNIDEYNTENNTSLGFDFSSILKLKEQRVNKKSKHNEEFELNQSSSGKKILKSCFEFIIDNNPNNNSIMKEIESSQSGFNSRTSSDDNPLLTIIFLPKVGNIEKLQKAFVNFIKNNNLWSNYGIAYSNFKMKCGHKNIVYDKNTTLTNFVDMELQKIKGNKDGLILLLGDQGSLGITYKKCDSLIMMDKSMNIDYYIQRIMRAMSDDGDKKIGCIVDFNLQRSLVFINHMRKLINKDKSIQSSLYDLITLNIFHFNPKDYNFMNYNKKDITDICVRISEQITSGIKEDTLLKTIGKIECIELEKILKNLKCKSSKKQNNTDIEDLNGLNKDLKTPSKNIITIDGNDSSTDEDNDDENDNDDIEDDDEDDTKKETNTRIFFEKAICILCLITKKNQTNTFQTMFASLSEKQSDLYFKLLFKNISDNNIDKSNIKEIIYINIMNISLQYSDLIEQIKILYSNARGKELYDLVLKHFTPSDEDKKNHAEVSTPSYIVGDKINKVPKDFWSISYDIKNKCKKLPKIYDPCCGKATYVMQLFDKLYSENIEEYNGDSYECCKDIMTTSLYYSDINEMNIFITNEIMKCHIETYCGREPDYMFNSLVCNVLETDILSSFNVKGFDMVIGNPPYNDDSGNKGKSHILWDKFITHALNKWLLKGGYLMFIHPSLWRQKDHELFKLMIKRQIIYLEIHNVEDGIKAFKCSTRYDWYLIENVNMYKETEIKDEDGIVQMINLNEWTFIPNSMFDEIKNLLAKQHEDKLDVHYYRSNYGADKTWVAGIKNETFKYPVVYSINKNNELSLKYSLKNTNGHFGLTKFIFSNGAGFYCDISGEYGLTQWAYCIYDEQDNLNKIETMFRNEHFKKIIRAIHLDSSAYNINIMKLFKKDIYKLF